MACVAVALLWGAGERRAAAQVATDVYLGFEGHVFDAGNIQLPYRMARPTGYDPAKKYPLVVFLHGSGESGTDNKLQVSKHMGVPQGGSVFTLPANQAMYPTFFVAPQAPMPGVAGWMGVPGQAVLKLIASLEQQFSIDAARLYLTGLSMGGYGTWALVEGNPKLFAAAVPMSGGGDTSKAASIAHLPIWDFHGTIDPLVPVQQSRDMIAALVAAGGHPRYTEYPNGQHDIWDTAYTEPALLPWIFAQHNGLDPNADGGAGDAAETPDASSMIDGPIGSVDAVAADAGTFPDSSGGFPFDAGQIPDSSGDAASPSDASAAFDSSGDATPLDDATGHIPSGQSTAAASSGCTYAMRERSTPWDRAAILVVCLGVVTRRRRAGRREIGLAR
jgi:predicted esterase